MLNGAVTVLAYLTLSDFCPGTRFICVIFIVVDTLAFLLEVNIFLMIYLFLFSKTFFSFLRLSSDTDYQYFLKKILVNNLARSSIFILYNDFV